MTVVADGKFPRFVILSYLLDHVLRQSRRYARAKRVERMTRIANAVHCRRVSAPACHPGGVLVQSLIFTGTEIMKLAEARTAGNPRYPKETLDNAAGGCSARLDNFTKAMVWSGQRQHTMRARAGQDKGQRPELTPFVEAVLTGAPMPIAVESLLATTRAAIAVGQSLLSGCPERV